VILFTGHLSTMLRSGVDVVRALETLAHQGECPNFGAVVHDVNRGICSGRSLSSSLALFPRIFTPLYVTMIRVGENTGNLTGSLDSLRVWMERDEGTASKIRSAFTYPALVLVMAALLTMMLFQTVIPQFMVIFENLDVRLPLVTRMVLFLTTLAKNPGSYLMAGAFAVVAAIYFRRAWQHPRLGLEMYMLFLHVPILGPMLKNASIARFATAAEMAMTNGLNIVLTVELGCAASGNRAMKIQAKRFVTAISEGESLATFMRQSPEIWGTFLPQMLAAGEEAASIAPMMARARDVHNAEVEHLVENLSAVLEPLLLFGVAILVGVVLLSVFLPLYSVLGSLGA
jgi:type IV pilus assembly protein PilC